jgi:hypothetical protein
METADLGFSRSFVTPASPCRKDCPVYTNRGQREAKRNEVDMKRRLTPKVWIAAALTMIGIASATVARADERLTAKVPFDFIVGNMRLPAGSYVFGETSTSGILAIESADRRHHVFVLTNGDSGKPPAQPELVFKRFEGQNFLFRITDGYAIEREVPLTPSTMERERQVAVARVTIPLTAH